MPAEIGAAAIVAGAQLLGAGGQAVATGKMNKKSRFHALRMYERQLEDNKELWDIQNKYNSPVESMKRLKEAGLNPNLVYGNGATTANADSIHTGAPGNPQFDTPDIASIGNSLGSFFDIRMKQAAIKNAEQAAANAAVDGQIKDEALIAAKRENRMGDTLEQNTYAQKEEDYNTKVLENKLRDQNFNFNSKKNQLQLEGMIVDQEKALAETLRTKKETELIPERKALIQNHINKLKNESLMDQFEIQLNSKGLTKSDPRYWRMLSVLWDEYKTKILNSIN